MAGLDPAIHVFLQHGKDVDARHKAGHDEGEVRQAYFTGAVICSVRSRSVMSTTVSIGAVSSYT